jgi:3-dehydroquinate dehydratase II
VLGGNGQRRGKEPDERYRGTEQQKATPNRTRSPLLRHSADIHGPESITASVTREYGQNGSMPSILLLHGPNLNLLGQREPEIYGSATLDDYVAACTAAARSAGLDLEAFQSNHEGALVDAIHAARGRVGAIVINPGAFTHYAWSLHDALAAFDGFKLEVHISNPNAREPWRHTSVVAPVVHGSIIGLGIEGYRIAVAEAARRLSS